MEAEVMAMEMSYEPALAAMLEAFVELAAAEDPDSPIGEAHKGDPIAFGSPGVPPGWTAATFVHVGDGDSEPPADESNMPGEILFEARFLYPSLGPGTTVDSRIEAQASTRQAFSYWRDRLLADRSLSGFVSDVEARVRRSGDFDQYGNARADTATGSVLWVLLADVRVIL